VSDLADRLRLVQERIDQAATSHGRKSEDITLIVVSKFHPAKLVLDLVDLGVSNFGENRDQEAKPKALEVAGILGGDRAPTWHFVGQLQSNKARSVLTYSRIIHSLDRPSLLKEFAKIGEPASVFIELNLTGDAGRGGVAPEEVESFAEEVLKVDHLKLLGVMGVAGLDRDPKQDFEIIQNCSTAVQSLSPTSNQISAGMSADFEAAIGFGATHLRIGTAITGNRN
jgi:pyridoxal phosphate enzyme (YggS family)